MCHTRKVIRLCFSNGYSVCEKTGDVFNKKGKKMIGCVRRNGYRAMCIYISGVTGQKGYQINQHQLVAYKKFGELMFQEGIEVRHLDGNKLNNNPDNIEIGTRSQNMLDIPPFIRSLRIKGKPSKNRKVSKNAVNEIKEMYKKGIKRGDCTFLAKKYNINKTTVSEIGRGITYNEQ